MPKDLDKFNKISNRWYFISSISVIIFIFMVIIKPKPYYHLILTLDLILWGISFICYKIYKWKYDDHKKKEPKKKEPSPFDYDNELFKKIMDDFFKNLNQIKSVDNKISNSYKLLKLKEDDSIQIIKDRYKELAIKWHPDKWMSSSVDNQKTAERNFKKLNNAYEIIKKHKGII